MAAMMRLAVRAFVVCALAACGGTGGSDDEGGDDIESAVLVIDPPTAEHMIVDGATPQQPYTATLTFKNGKTQDVTAETYFTVDPGLGSFSGNTLSLYLAGKGTVVGTWDTKTGSAQIIARLKTTRVVEPLPATTPDLFNGPEDTARAPNIVYPPLGVTMPRNVGDFETHWTDPHGNDIFEVSLKTEFSDVRVYVPGGNGVAAAGPMPSWTAFAAAEWANAVGTESVVQYQVRGVQSSNPGVVGAGAPRIVRLTNEPMEGGVYYWAARGAAYGIYRHDVSKAGQPAEEFMTTNQTAGRCVACHTISRDGTKMAITYDGGNGAGTLVDVATQAAMPDTNTWNFATFTKDATKVLTVYNGVLTVRDATTLTPVATMSSAVPVSHPDISPDGTRLVYVGKGSAGTDWNFEAGTIYTRTYDPVTNAFGAETVLVTGGGNNFYPSWSPDGQWVLFNRSSAGSAYDNVNAGLWVVKADGSAPPLELAAANGANGGLTNSWGRWAPFTQTTGANRDPMFWITVSSKRDFGVRRINSLDANNLKTPQIWMTPFDINKANAGMDPTAASFRLPFQNLDTNNHIAQWTERVVGAPQ